MLASVGLWILWPVVVGCVWEAVSSERARRVLVRSLVLQWFVGVFGSLAYLAVRAVLHAIP